jgi:hypothetical protein
MLIPNHPDDERLSALASHDDDATADAALTAHVSTCGRCTDLVTELGALRASLAELPDVAPSRPLQLLPPVDAPATSGAAVWVRRLFAPAITAGAALAMVGLIGTAGPLVGGMASSGAIFQNVGENLDGGMEAGSSAAPLMSTDNLEEPAAEGEGDGGFAPFQSEEVVTRDAAGQDLDATPGDDAQNLEATERPAERSPWPMVLFTGAAVIVGAVLLRWILVPRAG